jgi:hypothetical protein
MNKDINLAGYSSFLSRPLPYFHMSDKAPNVDFIPVHSLILSNTLCASFFCASVVNVLELLMIFVGQSKRYAPTACHRAGFDPERRLPK